MNSINNPLLPPRNPFANLQNTLPNFAGYESMMNNSMQPMAMNNFLPNSQGVGQFPLMFPPQNKHSLAEQRQMLLDDISHGNIVNNLASDLIDNNPEDLAFSYAYIPESAQMHLFEDATDDPQDIDILLNNFIQHKPKDVFKINEGARIWGDPHFIGADGDKYDVTGEIGRTYNLLSDRDLQINGHFGKYGEKEGVSIIDELGITMGDDKIGFNKAGELTINGETLTEDKITLDDRIEKKGNKVIVHADEYDLTLETVGGKYININFASDNATYDDVNPHGLWGLSVDGVKIDGDTDKNAQGGGAILKLDGTRSTTGDKDSFKAYEVGDIFDTSFSNFNRFDGL